MAKTYEKTTTLEGDTVLYEIETTERRRPISIADIDAEIQSYKDRIVVLEAEKARVKEVLR